MIRVGMFGVGTIGRQICRAVEAGIPGTSLAGGTGRDRAKAEAFLHSLPSKPPFLLPDELVEASDLVIEAATQAALIEFAPRVLGAGKDLMVLSCGALLRRSDWVKLAEQHRCRILVPSGAIAGLDGLKGARVGAIESVTMESRKGPRSWAGAPYIAEKGLDLDSITTETLLFEGPATAACPAFPANVNVLAALSLAGVGPERTSIKIFAVPGLTRNTHRITVEGEFGRLQMQVENIPSEENPRTGKLSYLSAIAMLRELGATLRVGA
ncbi:MAG: aspartate dehydrogenase [Candidatus Methylomirabilia bacterium]